MPRIARKDMNTSFFHVIVQGVNKEFIFTKDNYKRKYLKLLKATKEEYLIDIISYVIMYNHAHILLHTENIIGLSNFMKKVNEDYGRYYNYMENRVGHIFRDRFLSEPITNQKYLLNCIAYIHNNPVKANIVDKCENYRYSSYSDYLNMTGFIDEKVLDLVFGTKKLDFDEFRKMHLKKRYYFAEYENMTNQNMNEIISELEDRYKNKIEILNKNPKILKDVIIEIKERIKISNSSLAKYLKIDRNRINQLIK